MRGRRTRRIVLVKLEQGLRDVMADEIAKRRQAYAAEVTRRVEDPRIEAAFAAVPREDFAGPPPWRIGSGGLFGRTASDDPARLYDDVLVAIDVRRGINNGQPSLHAQSIDALRIKEGETVVQIGAGAGYYTAILAHLVGPAGKVVAYEIEPDIAERAKANLARYPQVEVRARSGVEDLPKSDAIYVNAAATHPLARLARRAQGRRQTPVPAPGGALDRRHAADHPAGKRRRLAGALSLRRGVHRLRRRAGTGDRPAPR